MALLGAASMRGVPALGLPKMTSFVGRIFNPAFSASPEWSTTAGGVRRAPAGTGVVDLETVRNRGPGHGCYRVVGIEPERADLQVEGYQPHPFGCEVGSQFHHGHVSRGPPIIPDSRFSRVRFGTLAFLPWAFPIR